MSQNENCTLTTLSRNQSIGLAFVVQAGLLSATSLAILAILLVRNVLRYRKYAKAYKWSLVQDPADVYVLYLFIADVMQAIGASMSARWVSEGTVVAGQYCTTQGVIQQLGETSVGLATALIAINTFASVWMKKQHRVRTAVIIVAICWTFMGLFVGIASGLHKNYDEPSPYWCWVGSNYREERIWGEYFWLWLTMFLAIAVYVPLFLWNQGYISIDEKKWWKVEWHWNTSRNAEQRPKASSIAILAYPLAYSIVVLPVSVVRWITFQDQKCGDKSVVPSAATFATVFLHDCFGFVNVLLLLTTRQTLLLFDDPRNQRKVRLRREAGGALEDGDDAEQIKGFNEANGRASPTDSILGGMKGRSEGNGIGGEAGNTFDDVDADAIIEMRMRELTSAHAPASPARPFLPMAPIASSDREPERNDTFDSGRDALGVVSRETRRKGSSTSGTGMPPTSPWQQNPPNARAATTVPVERRPGTGGSSSVLSSSTVRDDRPGSSGTAGTGGTHFLARLHSKTSSSGSWSSPRKGTNDEVYTDDEIARRFEKLTAPSPLSPSPPASSAGSNTLRWDS